MDAKMAALVTRFGKDTGIVPAIGQGKGHISVTKGMDFENRCPWRDMIGLGAHGEHGKPDISQRHMMPIHMIAPRGKVVIEEHLPQVFRKIGRASCRERVCQY